MNTLGSLRSANLLIAGVTRPGGFDASRPSSASTPQVHVTASGFAKSPSQGTTVAFDSIYSVNHVDANKLKINLMERVGKAFGLDINEFESAADMAGQIEKILEQLERDVGTAQAEKEIRGIEKDLGLDELGISLRDVLKAMKDPDSSENKKLMALLGEKAGDAPDGRSAVELDEIGLYRP